MTRAVFPATFDPIHNGHINIALRAAKLFDQVTVAVYELPQKSLLFPTEQRVELVREALKSEKKIEVSTYHELTIDYCREIGANVIVRGLRVFSDFEYEFRMALGNSQIKIRPARTVPMNHLICSKIWLRTEMRAET